MKRSPVAGFALLALALAACATVSGLADKEVVDCPGGCKDDGATAVNTPDSSTTQPSDSSTADTTPPLGDAEPGFVKPAGWELVAVAAVASGATPPACPSGYDDPSDVGTSPAGGSNVCECAACSVTQQATCTGFPAISNGLLAVCDNVVPTSATGPYDNNPAGGCNGDFSTTNDRTGQYVKVKPQPASGGACNAGAATPHPERVTFADRRRVCDETARCNGDVCDATVPLGFRACLASAKGSGDQACPAGFAEKLVAGAANVACGAGCGCDVTRTTCAGTFSYYKDVACTVGAATVAADDTCRNLNATGMYAAYKLSVTTTTGCQATGTAASTVTPKDVRTVCCR